MAVISPPGSSRASALLRRDREEPRRRDPTTSNRRRWCSGPHDALAGGDDGDILIMLPGLGYFAAIALGDLEHMAVGMNRPHPRSRIEDVKFNIFVRLHDQKEFAQRIRERLAVEHKDVGAVVAGRYSSMQLLGNHRNRWTCAPYCAYPDSTSEYIRSYSRLYLPLMALDECRTKPAETGIQRLMALFGTSGSTSACPTSPIMKWAWVCTWQ